MKRHILIICIILAVLPWVAVSKPVIHSPVARDEMVPAAHFVVKQDRPKGKQVKSKKADIKVVPKSRKQVKPTVVKPKVKGKPVKMNRPKIKKP